MFFFYDCTPLDEKKSLRKWKLVNKHNSKLPSDKIHEIYFSSQNKIWIGTWGDGLINFSFEKEPLVLATYNSCLPNNKVYMIKEDSKLNLWVATFGGGMYKYGSDSCVVYDKHNSGLGHDVIYNFDIDSSDNLWVGTWGDGLNHFDGETWSKIENQSAKIPYKVPSVLVENEKVFIGSIDGLIIKENDTFKALSPENSPLIKSSVYKLLKGKDQEVWLGYKTDGIAKFDGEEWTYFSESKKFRSYDMALDSQNNLWIAAYGLGLVKFDGNNWRVFDTQNSPIPDKYVFCVEVDKYDNIWVGTLGQGIAIYNENGITLDM
ncbi:MAG: two-component regulator propeller domain-containing protein [Rhodothermaceae bacterium]